MAPRNVDLRLRQRRLTTVRLPGYTGLNNDKSAVQTYVSRNTLTTVNASNTVSTGGGYVNTSPAGSACTQPS
jgi:hypothetical protein